VSSPKSRSSRAPTVDPDISPETKRRVLDLAAAPPNVVLWSGAGISSDAPTCLSRGEQLTEATLAACSRIVMTVEIDDVRLGCRGDANRPTRLGQPMTSEGRANSRKPHGLPHGGATRGTETVGSRALLGSKSSVVSTWLSFVLMRRTCPE
jgi:hypothetical protein